MNRCYCRRVLNFNNGGIIVKEKEDRIEKKDEENIKTVSDEEIVESGKGPGTLKVMGYVRDSLTRTPVPNSNVIATNQKTNKSFETKSGPNDEFHESGYYELRLDSDEEGIYKIYVKKEGYLALLQVVEVTGDQGLNFFLFRG
jgi:hypothetical protein